MRPFRFSKPKNPGFGISSQFYLSVLAATARLPEPREILSPQGKGGAVKGFVVPAGPGKGKDFLEHPLERGAYGLVTSDKTTVLRMLVLSKEEAGFDPESFLRSQRASELSPEMASRFRATWSLVQLSFRSHHPMVYPALDFLQDIAARIAILTDGLVADPLAERYLLPTDLRCQPRIDPKVDIREHISVLHLPHEGATWVSTRGMRKFSMAEMEIYGVPAEQARTAERFLQSIGQTRLMGRLAQVGDKVGAKAAPFQIAVGGLDRAVWDGIDCWELIPPTGVDAGTALSHWCQSLG